MSLQAVSAPALRRITHLLDVRELGASSCASRAMLAAANPAWAPLLSKRFPHAAEPPHRSVDPSLQCGAAA